MSIVEEMKNLAQEIITSYEARINIVGNIIESTHRTLENFRNEREEMSGQLRKMLADFESLRKKDFDNMMRDIILRQDQREKEVREKLKNFLEEHKKMAQDLKELLSNAESVRLEKCKSSLEDIKVRQSEREREVNSMLEDFQKEQENLSDVLKELLNKGEQIRIKDFKATLRRIRAEQGKRGEEVRTLLGKFHQERKDTGLQWQDLADTMRKKRLSNVEPKEG